MQTTANQNASSFDQIAAILAEPVTPTIEENAAHLVAALLSKSSGLDLRKFSIDVRADIDALRAQLDASGHLDARPARYLVINQHSNSPKGAACALFLSQIGTPAAIRAAAVT